MWKFLLFLGWIGILLLSAAGVFVGIFPSYLEYAGEMEIAVRLAVIVISFFYFGLFMRKFFELFKKGDDKIIYFENEFGRLGISLGSIDSIIEGVIKNVYFIKDWKIKSINDKNHVKVQLRLGADAVENIGNEITKLQQMITENVEKVTGIKIIAINVVVNRVYYPEGKILPKRGDI